MNRGWKNLFGAWACAAVYLLLVRLCIPLVYGTLDDRFMMEFVSGQYLGKPEPHAIFLSYWYALFLTGLYSCLPGVDWYAVCYLLIQAVCMGMILYGAFTSEAPETGKQKTAVLVFLFFLTLGLPALAQLTFTTTAAVLGVTVLFWYGTLEEIRWKDLGILSVLCFLTFQVRSSIFFMILPVCAVFWCFRQWESRKKDKNWMLPLAAAAVLGASLLGEQIGYGADDWQAYQEYNENRSAVFDYADYTFPRYEDAQDLYHSLGIMSKSQAKTLFYYNYTADEQITPEFFGAYMEAYDRFRPSMESPAQRLASSIKTYVKGAVSGRFHRTHALLVLGYMAMALLYVRRKNWRCCMEAACLLGVQLLLWIYLLYKGRMPERVIYSMNLMLAVTLLLLWRGIWKEIHLPRNIQKVMSVLALLVLCFLGGSQAARIRSQNMELSERNEEIENLKTYCMEHPENFYFNDVTSFAFSTWNVKLWREEPWVMNYMSLGDWMSYSPVWQEKLLQEGIASVKEALYESERVYLICSFDKGLEYLTALYEGVECTEVEKIPGFRIYRLEIL